MSGNAVIIFGVEYEANVAAIVKQARNEGSNLPIIAANRAEEINLPEGPISPCTLQFSHYIPHKYGKRSSDAQFEEWGGRLIALVRGVALASPEPQVNWYCSREDSCLSLCLHWQSAHSDHVSEVAEHLESSFLQLGGEMTPKAKASKCFVATAACGDPDAPEVLALRRFRDQVLLGSPGGRALVRAYYALGPHAARLIARWRALRGLVRVCVVRPAGALADRLCPPPEDGRRVPPRHQR